MGFEFLICMFLATVLTGTRPIVDMIQNLKGVEPPHLTKAKLKADQQKQKAAAAQAKSESRRVRPGEDKPTLGDVWRVYWGDAMADAIALHNKRRAAKKAKADNPQKARPKSSLLKQILELLMHPVGDPKPAKPATDTEGARCYHCRRTDVVLVDGYYCQDCINAGNADGPTDEAGDEPRACLNCGRVGRPLVWMGFCDLCMGPEPQTQATGGSTRRGPNNTGPRDCLVCGQPGEVVERPDGRTFVHQATGDWCPGTEPRPGEAKPATTDEGDTRAAGDALPVEVSGCQYPAEGGGECGAETGLGFRYCDPHLAAVRAEGLRRCMALDPNNWHGACGLYVTPGTEFCVHHQGSHGQAKALPADDPHWLCPYPTPDGPCGATPSWNDRYCDQHQTEGDDMNETTNAGTATGDAYNVETAINECNLLDDDLTAINTALDVIDERIGSAGTAAEGIEGFLRSKNVDDAAVSGMSVARDMLSPTHIKALIDAIAASKQGVKNAMDELVRLQELESQLNGADGSVLNGR